MSGGEEFTVTLALDSRDMRLLCEAVLEILSLQRTILKELRDMNAVVATDIPSALVELQAATASVQTVIGSAETLIGGIPALIQAAVTKALAAGATPEQLAVFDTLAQGLQSAAAGLAASVAANTPAPSSSTPTTTAGPESAGDNPNQSPPAAAATT